MKTLALFISGLLLFFLFFAGCLVNITGDVTLQPAADSSTVKTVSLIILGLYEVIVRFIPSIGDYSPLSWGIKLLKFISDSLNRKI